MKAYHKEPIDAEFTPIYDEYLRTRYHIEVDAPIRIDVGRGMEDTEWNPLACKEVYAQGIKTALKLECSSCLFDLSAAAELGQAGIDAAVEGIYGGGYQKRFAMTNQVEPSLKCYFCPEGIQPELPEAVELARAIISVRNMVNCPANILTPSKFSQELLAQTKGLPVQCSIYNKEELTQKGLDALLSVGASSENSPFLVVLRYNGAPDDEARLGLIGKGVTIDSGGYCLKSQASMAGIKGDMAGGAAVAQAVCALAATGAHVNVTAVIPICENRISRGSLLPGDVIGSLSGRTIEVLNTDAEGRLILADGLTWAIREENCTRLVDVATLTGAICAMLGSVAAGVMSNDDELYMKLQAAAELSGERYWRMPTFPEYERLIQSDFADIRNTSKDGCGSITAGLFLKRFTEDLPWLHLDIAGTADTGSPVWQHQTQGATGAAVSTLFHLALSLENH